MADENKRLVKEKRDFSLKKYATAFVLTVVVFMLGLSVGSVITSTKVKDILSLEKESRLQLESLELEEKLLEEMPCRDPSFFSEDLEDLSVKLTYLESEYDKNDPRILDLKKPYTLLEIRHYLKLKDLVKECNKNYTLILFFYSNSPENLRLSEEQGFVLSYLQKKFTSDKLKVYALDADIDLDLMGKLKSIYGVQTLPSTLIDGKLYAGFHDKEELENLINK